MAERKKQTQSRTFSLMPINNRHLEKEMATYLTQRRGSSVCSTSSSRTFLVVAAPLGPTCKYCRRWRPANSFNACERWEMRQRGASLARSPRPTVTIFPSLTSTNLDRVPGQGRAGQGGRSRSPGPGGFGSSFDNARLAYMIARLLTFRSGASTQAWGRELLALTPPYPRWSLIATLPHLPLSLPNIRKTLKEASKNNLKNVHVTMI